MIQFVCLTSTADLDLSFAPECLFNEKHRSKFHPDSDDISLNASDYLTQWLHRDAKQHLAESSRILHNLFP